MPKNLQITSAKVELLFLSQAKCHLTQSVTFLKIQLKLIPVKF